MLGDRAVSRSSLPWVRTAIAATCVPFAPHNLCICGMNKKFAIPSWLPRFQKFCCELCRIQASLIKASVSHKTTTTWVIVVWF